MKLARKLIRLLGPLLFVLILARIDLERLAEIFSTVRPQLLLGALLLYPGLIMIKAWRWHMLLHQQQINYSPAAAFVAYISSLGAGYLTPGRLGEFVKALYLRQDEAVPFGQALSSVLMDRLFDLYFLLVTACIALIAFSVPRPLSTLALAALLVGSLAPLIVLIPGVTRRLTRLLIRVLPTLGAGRYGEEIRATVDSFRQGMEQLLNIRLLLPLVVTVVAYAVFYLQCYLIAVALRLPLSYGYVAFCISIASLLALLPISVSGLGVRDAAFLALLLPLGVTPESAISFSLLILLVFNVFGGALAAITWSFRPLRWKSV